MQCARPVAAAKAARGRRPSSVRPAPCGMEGGASALPPPSAFVRPSVLRPDLPPPSLPPSSLSFSAFGGHEQIGVRSEDGERERGKESRVQFSSPPRQPTRQRSESGGVFFSMKQGSGGVCRTCSDLVVVEESTRVLDEVKFLRLLLCTCLPRWRRVGERPLATWAPYAIALSFLWPLLIDPKWLLQLGPISFSLRNSNPEGVREKRDGRRSRRERARYARKIHMSPPPIQRWFGFFQASVSDRLCAFLK